MGVLIPRSPEKLAGPFVEADKEDFEILAKRDKAPIVEFHALPEGVEWFEDFEFMYCEEQDDAKTVKVIRKATVEEVKLFRVPVWIQDEDVPECCGRPMHFVGQIDDELICTERPKGAKLWWHDTASFYVFTCSKCLKCKAVGQQY